MDREQVTEFTITVKATDFGSPRLSSYSNITITVIDTDDNESEFQPFYSGEINEDAPVGQSVLQITFHDADEVCSSTFKLTLLAYRPTFN